MAVADLAALIVSVQEPVPAHAPVHDAKNEPDAATGVSFTTVPELNDALQAVGQLIPAGLLVTVPLPVPAGVMVNVKVDWAARRLAQSMVQVSAASNNVRLRTKKVFSAGISTEIGWCGGFRSCDTFSLQNQRVKAGDEC